MTKQTHESFWYASRLINMLGYLAKHSCELQIKFYKTKDTPNRICISQKCRTFSRKTKKNNKIIVRDWCWKQISFAKTVILWEQWSQARPENKNKSILHIRIENHKNFTKKHNFWNLSSIAEIMWTICDFAIPSLFSTDISHSIPVPRSTTLTICTLAPMIGRTPNTCPFTATKEN